MSHVSLATYYFWYFAFIGLFSPFWPLYLQGEGFSPERIASVIAMTSVMRIFAPALWGLLADRWGRYLWIVRCSAAISAVAFAGVLFKPDFVGLMLILGVMGFFWSAALPLVETMTMRAVRHHASAYSRIRLWGSVGFIVLTMLGGVWFREQGAASVPWWVLVVLLGIMASTWLLRDEPPDHPPAARAAPRWSWLPAMLPFYLASLLMAFAHGPYYTFYSIHLANHGYDEFQIGLFWGLGVLCEIALFWGLPHVLRGIGLLRLFELSLLLAVIRFLLIGWAADSLFALLLAQILHAATFGAFHASAVSLVQQRVPAGQHALGQALFSALSFGLGGTLGGLAAGWAWADHGAAWVYTGSAVAALLGMLIARFSLK